MRFLLLPFSWLYGLVTDFRNYCYDNQFFSVSTFDKPIINVGNLTVGGTGKSPHVEYLIRLLKKDFSIVTLSRGYGRKTKGFILADKNATAETIGDEPMQFYNKYKNEVNVSVGEKRAEALNAIFSTFPVTDLVILDDAFQHRAVKPSLNILLMDFYRPIDKDFTFPAGRLRERRHGAKRADILIVSKCPDDLLKTDQQQIASKITPYLSAETPIFFTGIRYGVPQIMNKNSSKDFAETVLLVSGIARPETFETYCRQHFKVTQHLIYKDHHHFTDKDLDFILETFHKIPSTNKSILMTEKDMVKFQIFLESEKSEGIPMFYLPIEIYFLNESGEVFNELVLKNCKPSKSKA
ncbi:tetraacyldisaccharide 4'-kinase [Arcicella sp. DC2W]|uniref:Tetraacyldisaccharide 4'-kinase n=1 Tax=Arcicella gelida TaxID=2984195 RepID=A0ABU5S2C7_9BACT|nr:tetraacyldisaccharide 4'-kinase [Arcicella sp. DC2W]MEA5402585.1 tetraacyldisaccharide 4'-kinase [Arcicella sp. DC2W]